MFNEWKAMSNTTNIYKTMTPIKSIKLSYETQLNKHVCKYMSNKIMLWWGSSWPTTCKLQLIEFQSTLCHLSKLNYLEHWNRIFTVQSHSVARKKSIKNDKYQPALRIQSRRSNKDRNTSWVSNQDIFPKLKIV